MSTFYAGCPYFASKMTGHRTSDIMRSHSLGCKHPKQPSFTCSLRSLFASHNRKTSQSYLRKLRFGKSDTTCSVHQEKQKKSTPCGVLFFWHELTKKMPTRKHRKVLIYKEFQEFLGFSNCF